MREYTNCTNPRCNKKLRPFQKHKPFCSTACRIEFRKLKAKEIENLNKILKWVICNDVAHKLTYEGAPKVFIENNPIFGFKQDSDRGSLEAIGWAMFIENRGWFGRIRDSRGDWSFGPSTLPRARKAIEARIRHEIFEKTESEKTWTGNCMTVR